MLAGLAVVAVVAVTLLSFGAAAPVVMGAIAVGGGAVIAKGISDCISGTVSSRESYMKAGFWGAVTGAAAAIGGAATAAAKAPAQVASLAAKSAPVKKMFLNGCDGVWDTLKENALFGQETTFQDLVMSFAISAFTAGQGDEVYRGYNKVDGLIEGGVKHADEIVEGVAKQADEIVEGVAKQADEVAEGIAKQTDEVIERAAEHSDELIESTAKQADELVENITEQADETLGAVGQKMDDLPQKVNDLPPTKQGARNVENDGKVPNPVDPPKDEGQLKSDDKEHMPSTNTQVIQHPEIKSPTQVNIGDVTNYWDDYLGSDQTNMHPRTRMVDNDRIFSSDGTRSVRFGKHEMDSMGTPKFHFHLEKWEYDPVNDVMEYFNTLVRIKE